MAEPPRMSDERRAALLSAAAAVFVRYGYRKASMDDVARAGGLSRQGLYLHFPTKEALFREALTALLERDLANATAALAEGELEDRLVRGFDAMHGAHLDELPRDHMAELMETAARLVGDRVRQQEADLLALLTATLEREGVAFAGVSTRALALTLDAASHGIKQQVTTRREYLERLRIAVRLICGLASRVSARGSSRG